MTSAVEGMSQRRATLRESLVSFIELAALSGFAIAMPVLDVFGRAPEVFTEAKASSADLWWFAVLIAFVPPVLLVAVELIITAVAGKRVALLAHHAIVALLGGLIAVRAIRISAGIEGVPLLVIAILLAVLVTIGYTRFGPLRQWLRFGSFSPFLFASVFLFSSPAHSLAQGAGKEASTAVPIAEVAKKRPPIVLLVLDELPIRSLLDSEGNIDAERFPGFGALAEDSTWFRNATSVASHTVNAVPAIFTGRYASVNERSPVAREHPNSIFRLFGNAYRFNVSELTTQLCAVPRCEVDNPENAPTTPVTAEMPATDAPKPVAEKADPSPLATLLKIAADEYGPMVALHDIESEPNVEHEDLVAVPTTQAPATTTVPKPVDKGSITPTTVDRGFELLPVVQPTRFSDWLDRIDSDTENPALNVVHVTMPHGPFHLDSTGTDYLTPDDGLQLVGLRESRWDTEPGAAISIKLRHLLQVRYVDTLVAALHEHLEELEIWDEAVVIVTADHGASFDPGGTFRALNDQSQTDILGVPLFVHAPGFEPGITDDRPVQSVDIAPTLAALAAIDPPWRTDGIDLAKLGDFVRTKYRAEALLPGEHYAVKTVDVSRHLEQILARLPHADADGGDDIAILRNGPSGHLIGTRLEEMTIDDNQEHSVDIEFPENGNFTITKSGLVPAFIVGDVNTGSGGQTVVVAVDGRIAATALTFDNGDNHEAHFTALIPPTWMKGDDHDVAFYLLADGGALTPLD